MYDDIEFIIACAGKSTRNYPHSKAVAHKCLMPFGDVRLIDYVLKDIVRIGGRHVTIVCSDETTINAFKQALAPDTVVEEKLRKSGRGKIADALKSTFLPDDMDVKYVIQDKPWGTAHVLGLAHRVSPNRHAVLIFPDDLIDSVDSTQPYIKKLIDAFKKNPKQILLTGVEQDDVSNNAILQDKRLIEKPKHPKSRIAGYSPYVFPKECLDSIERETCVIEQMGHLPDGLALGEWVYTDGINSFLDNGGEEQGFFAKMFMIDTSCYKMLDTGNLELYEAALIRELLLYSSFKERNMEVARRILNGQ
ncbi:MAG: NTP transferase domain-containing protein [Alphaproteobacteria bacterium]|nr:NTP transferase domain-containing protein [Alphaproteobacteria bacterium]